MDLLNDKRAAMAGSFLFAISPAMIRYAQEARMYALLTLLVMLALRGAVTKNNWKMAPALSLMMLTQNMGALYAAPIAIYALITQKKKALLPLAAAAAGYLPWLPSLISQTRNLGAGFWTPASGNPGGLLYNFQFNTLYVANVEWSSIHIFAAAIILTAASIVGIKSVWKKLIPLLMIAYVPPLLMYLIELVWHPVMVNRITIPAGAAMLALWGIAAVYASKWLRRPALAIGIPTFIFVIFTYYFLAYFEGRTDMTAIKLVNAKAEEGDIVYLPNVSSVIGTDYYTDLTLATVRNNGDLAQTLSDQTIEAMGLDHYMVDPGELDPWLGRIWLFDMRTPVVGDVERAAMDYMLDTYHIVKKVHIADNALMNFDVYILDPRVGVWSGSPVYYRP
jgi:hypothetical protein